MTKEKNLRIRNSTAEFLIFTKQCGEDSIEIKVDGDTVWLTQELIAKLYNKERSTIAEHLQNLFNNKELNEFSVCRKCRQAASDGNISAELAKTHAETEFEKY